MEKEFSGGRFYEEKAGPTNNKIEEL